jgi:REP element-mobilizing transposase RayT
MSTSTPRSIWKRASILLWSHDYSGGACYFITISSVGRRQWFGKLGPDDVLRSPIGDLVIERWWELSSRLPFAHFGDLVVMPDHLHGLIRVWPCRSRSLHEAGPRRFGPLPRRSLALIVNLLKGGVTRRARELGLIAPTARIWLRGYHDRVIRDAHHLANARAYIRNNPTRAIESAGRGWDGRA